MAALHDSACQKACLPTTGSAFQYARPRNDAKRFCHDAAVWAHEATRPASPFQIGRASRVIGEKPLELGKGFRKSQMAPLMDVHTGHGALRRFRSYTTAHAFSMDTH
jgi:hypothetical protein